MKTPHSPVRGLSLALLLGFLTAPLAALAQIPYDPPTATGYASDFYPPRTSSLDGAGPLQYPGTPVVARNVMLHSPSTSKPSPISSGQIVIVNFGMTFVADVSSNGGASFSRVTGPAEAVLRNTNVGPAAGGGTRYDTEMLQLNLTGGGLPPGVMIRESPTLASTGQTVITPQPGGHHRIDSFFDIFTELSLNGGASWIPSPTPLHVEMHRLVPEVRVDVAAYPPPDRLVETIGTDATTYPPLAAVVDELELDIDMPSRTFADLTAQPSIHGVVEVRSNVSLDGGATFQPMKGTGSIEFTVQPTTIEDKYVFIVTAVFELTAAGGGTVMIRESPTRQSLGQTSVRALPDGGFMISGFFDVFTELSLDGGATWTEGIKPIRLELAARTKPNGVPTTFFPPRNARFAVDNNDLPVLFANGTLLRNMRHNAFQGNLPLPPSGSLTITSTHTVGFETSTDGGATWQARSATGVMAMACTGGSDDTFDTEMLSLNIGGGNLPNGWMIRESPTRASTGLIRVIDATTGAERFRIGSFFDIFTELSVDGGATWFVSDAPATVRMELLPPRGFHPSDFLPLRATFASIDNAPEEKERFVGDNTPVIRGSALGGLNTEGRTPPPDPGATAIHSFFDVFVCEMSLDGGQTWSPVSAPAAVTTRTTGLTGGGTTRTFDTEMLQLDIQGGSLPPGFMIRESPTRASTGRMTIAPADGGFRIGSFFDIFTEISTDGGATWLPAVQAVRKAGTRPVEYVVVATDSLPTPGELRVQDGDPGAQTATGFVFHKIEWSQLSGPSVPLPPPAGSVSVSQQGVADVTWTPGPGQPQMTARAPVNMNTVSYPVLSADLGKQTIETEMIALDIQGGGLPAGVMIRESPTRVSRGPRQSTSLDGSRWAVDSFFDIFTEVSLDGGTSWHATDRPLRVELVPEPVRVTLPAETLPRALTISNAPGTRGREYPIASAGGGGGSGKVSIQDFNYVLSSPPAPLPPTGGSVVADFNGDGRLDLVIAGMPPVGGACVVTARVQVTHRLDSGGTRVFDTEMLQLDIQGSSLPAGVMIRESPSRPSLGRATARALPGGTYHVDSFFDVFTEISLDGGATWSPSDGPLRLEAAPVPPPVPLDSTHYATTDFFPPPGLFEMGDIQFPDGSLITGMTFAPAPGSPRVALPPAGLSVDVTLDGTVSFTFTDAFGLASHVTVGGTLSLRVSGAPPGADRYFDTEMLALSLNGLPPGVPVLRFRESPTLPSLGATRVTDGPNGGFFVSSFFDVFTELSLDGGATWQQATGPAHAELEAQPPIVGVPTDYFPPRTAVLRSLPHAPPVDYGGGHLRRTISANDFHHNARLVDGAAPAIITTSLDVTFELSLDGGLTWQTHTAPATATLNVAAGDVNNDGVFDTEMLQLDIAGGTLPAGVRLRESPTRASTGRTTLRTLPDGNFAIDSFFDIFTELSVDGGMTWMQTTKPESIVLDTGRRRDFYASNFLPLRGTMAMDDWESPVAFVTFGGILAPVTSVIAPGVELRIAPGGPRIPPPALGETQTHEVTGTATFDISQDGGLTYTSVRAPLLVSFSCTADGGNGPLSYSTEMISLTVQGGDLPPGMILRESPTRASTGRIQIDTTRGGFTIDSFFDVFTEISADGGANWSPATDTMHLVQRAAFDPVVEVSPTLPPYGALEMRPGGIQPRTEGGTFVSAFYVQPQFTFTKINPPSAGAPVTVESTHRFLWDSRSDLGVVTHHEGDVLVVVQYTLADSTADLVSVTVEFALDITDDDPTPSVRLRESPTRQSLGRTNIRQLPGGNWAVDSFFDVFTELSTDGGNTWSPTDVPMQLMLLPAVQKVALAGAVVPGGSILSHALGGVGREYPVPAAGGGGGGAGKVQMQDFHFTSATPPTPLPPPGATIVADLSGDGLLDLFLPDGTPLRATVNLQAQALVTSDFDLGGTRHFDTEMLQLSITGAGLPPGMLIRESPTLKSTGKTAARMLPGGNWQVDSFFDIFTEISLDGGASWTPSDGPLLLNPASVPPATPAPAHFATTDFFPPPGELILGGSVTFSDGSTLDRLTFLPSPTSPRVALPPPGVSVEVQLDGSVSIAATSAAGSSFSVVLPGEVLLRVTGGADGDDRYFDTEMLALSLNGLPPGMPLLRFRESPTLPSLGATRVTAVDGGFMVSSFFDVFFDVSIDGGGTWSSATGPGHVELEPSAPLVVVPTSFYPPRICQIGTLRNAPPTVFPTAPQPMRIRNLRHVDFESNMALTADLLVDNTWPHVAEFEVSIDGGLTWQPHTAPATAVVRITDGDVSGDGIFDTEMLQLDIAGGTLPAGVHLRESPSRASLGRTTLVSNADGTFRIGSFFDIFTELSLDGGASWTAAHEAAHVVQQRRTQKLWLPSNFRLSLRVVADDPDNGDTVFVQSPAILRAVTLGFTETNAEPPPAPGTTRQLTFVQDMFADLSLDGGLTFTPVTAPATITVRITNNGGGANGLGTFDTEMLALEIQGGSLPAGVMLRESPTRQSLGRTTIDPVDGGFRIGSFFDVFTELSLDGGGSWSPSADTVHLEERISSGQPTIVENDRFLSRGVIGTQPGGIEPLANGVSLEEVSFAPIFSQGIALPPMGGAGVTATLPIEFTAVWRQDFGQVKADRHTEVRIRITPRDQFGNIRTFDTEMLSLSLDGGGGAGGSIHLRESPTRASLGRLTVESLPDGTYRVDSFFDIFTEISLDGGSSWLANDVPARAMLLPAVQKVRDVGARTSSHARVSAAADGRGLTYAGGGGGGGSSGRIAFFDVFADIANPLPPAGGSSIADFDGDGRLDLAIAGGPVVSHLVTVQARARIDHDSDNDGVSHFDTEMLQLDITGPTLPPGVMLRENPLYESKGGIKHNPLYDGTHHIDSFFDVFTELSLDGGATWQPSDGALRLDFTGQSRGLVTGADQSSPPVVRRFIMPDMEPDMDLLAYPASFTGGVRVAVGDVNGDGTADIITGAGPGAGPHVKVFSGVDGRAIRSFLAFEPSVTGGVFVAAGDLDGDRRAELIVGAAVNGHVKAFSGSDGGLLHSFFAYGAGFTGGVRVAAGDVNGDGFADIITGSGSGTQPHVKVFDGRSTAELHSFFAYAPAFTGGVFVAAGDVNGDGRADLITGADAGGAPHVRVFDGTNLAELHSFFAYGAGFTGGVRVAAGDLDGDGRADLITGSGLGAQPHVKVFDGRTGAQAQSFFPYPPAADGVFVAGIPPAPRFPTAPPDLDGDGLLDTWEYGHFASIDPATFDTDSDDDGLSDGLELGLGSNPLAPDAFGQAAVTVEGGYLTMTLQRQPGVLYEVQSARRLLLGLPDSFSPATTTILIDTPNLLKVRDNFLIGTPPSRFIRGVITGAP